MKRFLSVGGTLVIRGAAAGGGILLSILVGRMTGTEGLGRFAVFVSLLGALGILSRRGLDVVLIRAAWGYGERQLKITSMTRDAAS